MGLADVPDAVSKVAHERDGQLLSPVADDTADARSLCRAGSEVGWRLGVLCYHRESATPFALERDQVAGLARSPPNGP